MDKTFESRGIDTLRWEKVADGTMWGRYVSRVEKKAVLESNRLALEPSTVLDIGCEGGRWSKLLFDLGWKNIICTDINEKALEICQRRIQTAKCILVNPNDEKIPCDNETIGLLLCMEVPPVINSEWFIHEAFRVLQNGGLVVGVFQNLLSFRGLFRHLGAFLANGYDYYKLSYAAWKRTFCRKGFTTLYEEGFCWFPFYRESNSPLIPLFTKLEHSLGLRRIAFLSPWIVFIARKY